MACRPSPSRRLQRSALRAALATLRLASAQSARLPPSRPRSRARRAHNVPRARTRQMQVRPPAPTARRATSACKVAPRNSRAPRGPSRPRPARLLARTAPPACTVAWALSVGVAAARVSSARHGRGCSSRALLDALEARRGWWTKAVPARVPRASTAKQAV